jgi:quercetin dioxygenase-like cupin family protein
MHFVKQRDLPFTGMSHAFVGADQGNVQMSAYLVDAAPGRSSKPHTHPYDTIAFVREGKGEWTVNGVAHQAEAGDILVVKANEPHFFTNTGDRPLLILDVHMNERIVQVNLEE